MPLLITENLQKKSLNFSSTHVCICVKDATPLLQIWRSRFGVLLLCCFSYYKTNFASLCPWPSPIKLRCIKRRWLLFVVILFSVWSVEISSRFGQWCLQLHVFQERLSEKMCTWQSWKVARDMIKLYTVLDNSSCWTYFCCFPLALANMLCPWTLVPLFQISLKNMYSELKATHIYLSGLLCALFATMFLEIADVYLICCIFLY